MTYEELIEKAKKNTDGGYKEKHHIIPTSLGGTDDEDNLVYLTPEEHFEAHYLLWKKYQPEDWQYEPMLKAFMMMNVTSSDHEYRHEDAVLFGEARRAYSTLMTTDNPMHKQINKDKLADTNSGARFMNKDGVLRYVNKDAIDIYLERGWEFGYGYSKPEEQIKKIKESRANSMWITDGIVEKNINKDDFHLYEDKGFRANERLPSEKGSKAKQGWNNPAAKFFKIYNANDELVEVLTRAEIIEKYPKTLTKPGVRLYTTGRAATFNKEIHKKFRGFWSEEITRQEAELHRAEAQGV